MNQFDLKIPLGAGNFCAMEFGGPLNEFQWKQLMNSLAVMKEVIVQDMKPPCVQISGRMPRANNNNFAWQYQIPVPAPAPEPIDEIAPDAPCPITPQDHSDIDNPF